MSKLLKSIITLHTNPNAIMLITNDAIAIITIKKATGDE